MEQRTAGQGRPSALRMVDFLLNGIPAQQPAILTPRAPMSPQAVFLGTLLTAGWSDLDRLPLAFKSCVQGQVYR